ncbi:MAG TPA: hypothetical protein VMY37_40065, partial [Thermoguttaceae bacterium]|nr:hypothetical protein [Thermoguttaceae bacterium]
WNREANGLSFNANSLWSLELQWDLDMTYSPLGIPDLDQSAGWLKTTLSHEDYLEGIIDEWSFLIDITSVLTYG